MIVKENLLPIERIENRIQIIRGQKVMIAADLAELYGVPTKALNKLSNAIANAFRRTSCIN